VVHDNLGKLQEATRLSSVICINCELLAVTVADPKFASHQSSERAVALSRERIRIQLAKETMGGKFDLRPWNERNYYADTCKQATRFVLPHASRLWAWGLLVLYYLSYQIYDLLVTNASCLAQCALKHRLRDLMYGCEGAYSF
jgi:hypothetical protein